MNKKSLYYIYAVVVSTLLSANKLIKDTRIEILYLNQTLVSSTYKTLISDARIKRC